MRKDERGTGWVGGATELLQPTTGATLGWAEPGSSVKEVGSGWNLDIS